VFALTAAVAPVPSAEIAFVVFVCIFKSVVSNDTVCIFPQGVLSLTYTTHPRAFRFIVYFFAPQNSIIGYNKKFFNPRQT